MKKQNKNIKGFTLIEILVAIAIIGVLAASSIPLFKDYQKKTVAAACKAETKALSPVFAEIYSKNNFNYSQMQQYLQNNDTYIMGRGVKYTKNCIIGLIDDPSRGLYLRGVPHFMDFEIRRGDHSGLLINNYSNHPEYEYITEAYIEVYPEDRRTPPLNDWQANPPQEPSGPMLPPN